MRSKWHSRSGWAIHLGFLYWATVVWVGPASAASVMDLRLTVDGSTEPPGDLIAVTLVCQPEETSLVVQVRAFLVSGENNTHVVRVGARGDRNRDEQGKFLAIARLAGPAGKGAVSLRVPIPYTDMDIPKGTHQLGYEVCGLSGENTAFVRALPLTKVSVSEQARTTMNVVTTRPETVSEKRSVPVFFGGARSASEKREVERRSVEMTSQRTREVAEVRQVAVNIRGGFERESLPAAPVPPPEPGQPAPAVDAAHQPWMPLADLRPEDQRLVRFVTNRAQLEAPENSETKVPDRPRFGAKRAEELTYGACVVNVPVKFHRRGRLELPSWWQLRDIRRSFSVDSVSLAPQDEFFASFGSEDILVLVHGFNNTFDGAVMQATQLQYDLEFPGTCLTFCWPSAGSVTAYNEDAQQAQQSVAALAETLRNLLALSSAPSAPPRKIHLAAHSMGNRILLNALYELQKGSPVDSPAKPFGQIVLAAPDIGAATFNNLIDYALDSSEQVTYYFCRNDAALQLSQGINRYEPVGLYPYFQRGLCTISADYADTSFMGHTYFSSATQVLLDVHLLLCRALRPEQRVPPLATREQAFGHDYWTFPTPAITDLAAARPVTP